jgi:acid phosphatase
MAEPLLAKREHLTQLQMHRHGSRGPATEDELAVLNSLAKKLKESHDAIQQADLPENLRFLKKGYDLNFEPQNLTIIGRQQLFNHGVEYVCPLHYLYQTTLTYIIRFGLKYPSFTTETLLSSDVTRVIDSMYFFAVGRFGREVVDKKLLIFNDTRDGVSWITPWASCPGLSWSYASEASNQVSRRLLTLTY